MGTIGCARALARARGRSGLRAAAAACLALACAGPGVGARYGALEGALAREGAGAPEGRPALDDDPFAGEPTLARERLVEAVLRRSPTLRSAREASRAALAQVPQATALGDPMIAYSVAPRSLGASDVRDGHQVELAQPLPFPGTLRLRGEEALAGAEAAGHDREAARLRLATLASTLFDELYLNARALEVNHHHAELMEELREVARARYEAGEVSAQAPLGVELELAQLERERATLEAAGRIAAHSLNALLHRRPDAPLPPPPALLEPAPAPAGDTDTRRAAALAARPELRAAEAAVRGREASLALARRAFLPEVTLTAGYDGLWEEPELRPMVGLSFEIPLQLGRRRAALAEAEARLEQARSERAALEADVLRAVESGSVRVEEAQRVLAVVRERLLPAARDQLEAARAAFESGQEGLAAVIDAEEALREVELGEHEALAALDRSAAELASATGVVPGRP